MIDGRDPEPVGEILRRVPEAYRAAPAARGHARRLRRARRGVARRRARGARAMPGPAAGAPCASRSIRVGTDCYAPNRRADDRDASRGRAADRRGSRDPAGDLRAARHRAHGLCRSRTTGPRICARCSSRNSPTATRRDGRRGFFHPDDWTFGQPLYASQIIGRALAVHGRRPRAAAQHAALESGHRRRHDDDRHRSVRAATSLRRKLVVGPYEIIQVANDPDHLETGRIVVRHHRRPPMSCQHDCREPAAFPKRDLQPARALDASTIGSAATRDLREHMLASSSTRAAALAAWTHRLRGRSWHRAASRRPRSSATS